MKKREVLIFAALLISIFIFAQLVYAANDTIAKDEKAYNCLTGKVEDKCSSLTLEEQSFSLLALSYDEDIGSECYSSLISQKSEAGCFPKSSCTIKDTSQAVIALNYVGIPTADSEGWIIGKRTKATSLIWYLEIDTKEASSCTVKYGSTIKVDIDVNKKITSVSGGDCLSKSSNGYWLEVSDSCLSKNYTIECNKDFITTLLYQKDGSDVWYVSSDVKSASAKSTTTHSIDSYCFSKTSDCDYEASLWAVLALRKAGYNVKPYLPYIIAFASDNKKYFPQTFLYLLTNSEDYLADTITLQKTSGYWDVGGIRGKFYDTALGLLVTQSSSDSTTTAKEWLFDNQDSSGCWNNNLKDTAFLLYSGWPKTPVKLQGAVEKSGCVTSGYYCVLSDAACENANGNVLDANYQCSGMRTCCSKPEELESCANLEGTECSSGKVCDEAEVIALDTDYCCLGTCIDSGTQITECASQGSDYSCRIGTSCFSGEKSTTLYDCNTGSICCKTETKKSTVWIWILIILIIILILLIIFRNRIKMFFFKKKSGVSTSNVSKSRPPFYPPSNSRMQMPRFIPTSSTRTPSKRDKELEETMKKLREMSK